MPSKADTKPWPWLTILTFGIYRPKINKPKQEASQEPSSSTEKSPPVAKRRYTPRYAHRDAAMCIPAADRSDIVPLISEQMARSRWEHQASEQQERQRRASMRAVGLSDASSGRLSFSQYSSRFAPYEGTTNYAKVNLAYQDMYGRGSTRPSSLRSASSERQLRNRRSAIATPSPLADVDEAAEVDGEEYSGEVAAVSPRLPKKGSRERASWHHAGDSPYAWKGDVSSLMSAQAGSGRRHSTHRKSAGDLEVMFQTDECKGKANVVLGKSADESYPMRSGDESIASTSPTSVGNKRLRRPWPAGPRLDALESVVASGPPGLPDGARLSHRLCVPKPNLPAVSGTTPRPRSGQSLPMHQRRSQYHLCARDQLGSLAPMPGAGAVVQPTPAQPGAAACADRTPPRLDSFEGPGTHPAKCDGPEHAEEAKERGSRSRPGFEAAAEICSSIAEQPWLTSVSGLPPTTVSAQQEPLQANGESKTAAASEPSSTKESTASSDHVDSPVQTQPATPLTPAAHPQDSVEDSYLNKDENLRRTLEKVRHWLAEEEAEGH